MVSLYSLLFGLVATTLVHGQALLSNHISPNATSSSPLYSSARPLNDAALLSMSLAGLSSSSGLFSFYSLVANTRLSASLSCSSAAHPTASESTQNASAAALSLKSICSSSESDIMLDSGRVIALDAPLKSAEADPEIQDLSTDIQHEAEHPQKAARSAPAKHDNMSSSAASSVSFIIALTVLICIF